MSKTYPNGHCWLKSKNQATQTCSFRFYRAGLLSLTLLGLAGCETLEFYGQAVQGQWQLIHQRQSVQTLISDPETSAQLRAQLVLSQDILAFADSELDLPADGRYQNYVDLKRDFVVWNVFVSSAQTIQAHEWCYPIVGCAPYRGYFSERQAQAYAAQFFESGFDVYVAGVPAYSTLGWFADPLMSSFIDWQEGYLANLLIHELAHSKIWLKSNVVFNESFASFVADIGVERWFAVKDLQGYQDYLQQQATNRRFRSFLLESKTFASQALDGLLSKKQTYQIIRDCYQTHLDTLGGGRYNKTMDKLNNAYFVSIGTYNDYQSAFAQLFENLGEDLSAFYAQVQLISELPDQQRIATLEALTQQYIDTQADDNSAEQIHCQSFAGHLLHGESAG